MIAGDTVHLAFDQDWWKRKAHEVQDEAEEARLADMLAKQKRGCAAIGLVASQKLRADVADLAEGIVSHQELEEEKERLVELTNALTEENRVLRAALQT